MEPHDPNFPPHLAIAPSAPVSDVDARLQSQISLYGLAGRTWEAARSLQAYLSAPAASAPGTTRAVELFGSRCCLLELGSGTGHLALNTVHLLDDDSRILVTDLENVVPLLRENIALFPFSDTALRQRVVPLPLPWGSQSELETLLESYAPTAIICSDLIYFPQLYPVLLRTLLGLTASNTSLPILLAYKSRSLVKEESFWTVFGRWFTLDVLRRGDDDNDEVWLFWCVRKSEGQSCEVEEDDQKLMQGGEEGASDRFELLLFGGLEY